MAFSIHIEQFEGPLDLLLKLVESEELEITSVSLAQVTEPFLQHLRAHERQIPPEELADFLVVAAKLVYLKSKALLPELHDPSLEEGPSLESQLRMYKLFADAAQRIGEMTKYGPRSFSRIKRTVERPRGFAPPTGVTSETVRELFERVVRRLAPMMQLPKVAIERAISLEEKIEDLRARVQRTARLSFQTFLAEAQDRQEVIVSFLALLELIKQRIVTISQRDVFHEIHLTKYDA